MAGGLYRVTLIHIRVGLQEAMIPIPGLHSWPDQTSDWNRQWDGFFGKNIKNADLETFFVFDDNEDRQYIDQFNFRPDAGDSTRGGLGMQVRARGFQWSQVLAEDVIFWYYEITNMSTTDYPKTLFAQYIDWGIGGHDNSSNNAALIIRSLISPMLGLQSHLVTRVTGARLVMRDMHSSKVPASRMTI